MTQENLVRIILPTKDMVSMFRQMTSSMSCVDYDLDEVINTVVASLQNYHTLVVAKEKMVAMFRRHSGISKDNNQLDDGEILAHATSYMFDELLDIFLMLALWNDSGFCDFYYDRELFGDIILVKMPNRISKSGY